MFIDAFFGASCDFVDVNGCFGNDDVFRAARDCRIKSDVAAISAHDFKHHDTAVRSRRVAKFHNRVDDGVASGVEADRVVGVTFDIDANGIVKVSAKDLGTGKEQNITITASTNMSKEDIDKAVKEAEQFAADDKKKREEVDIRNGADQMVFQTEKMLKENGDKLPADVKSDAEAKLADLKTAVQSGNVDDIKAKQEALSQVFEKMYQAAAAAQQAAGAQPGPDAGANNQQKPGDDGVVDADFKEV